MKSETRTVHFLRTVYNVEQTAISWCTTHDYQAMSDVIGCPADYRGLDGSCEISTGGPDHKWWKDIE